MDKPGTLRVYQSYETNYFYYFYGEGFYVLTAIPFNSWKQQACLKANTCFVSGFTTEFTDSHLSSSWLPQSFPKLTRCLDNLRNKFKDHRHLREIIGSAMFLFCIGHEEELLETLRKS